MRLPLSCILLVSLWVLPAWADEPPVRLPESVPPPIPAPEAMPAPLPAPAPEACPAPCVPECLKVRTTYRLHWLERDVPFSREKYEVKEIVNDDIKCYLDLDYTETTNVKTELVLKPREVLKEVTCCTQKPISTVDPCTGCPKICYEPVTETKTVKEIVYDLVPEEKVYKTRTAYLKPKEQPIHVKTLALQCTTECGVRKERFGVVVPCEETERILTPPPPPLPPLPLPCPSCGH